MSSITNYFKNNFLIILIISLPFFFVIGPALVEFTSLIFFFYFLNLFSKKNELLLSIFRENKSILIIFLLFYLLLLISSFLSENYFLSFKNTAFYFRFLIFSIIILYCLNYYNQLSYTIFYGYLILYSFIFFSSLFEFSTGNNFFNNSPILNGRVSSVFLDEQIMGSFIVKNLPLIFGLLYLSDLKYKSFIAILLILVGLFLVLISGERTAFALFLILIILVTKIRELKYYLGLRKFVI